MLAKQGATNLMHGVCKMNRICLLMPAVLLTVGCGDPDGGLLTKKFPPDHGDTDVTDSGGNHDTAQDTSTHDSNSETGGRDTSVDTDTAPDECADAQRLCGMDLDDQIELREEWGADIVTQNDSSGYNWSSAADVARGIAVGGLYPPTPDFPDTTTYPSAYNDATDILNNTYGWGWCCSVLDWAAEYDDPEWITIHHTAGRFDDTREYVAFVYNFHTYGQDHGWGDIGYQALVGKDADDGEIHHFEGRFSGDTSASRDPFGSLFVIGACVGDHNTDNTCIASIGDYSSSPPDTDEFEALMQQTARTAYEIGLTDTSHIIGHRDWSGASTECPGQELYDMLPQIRDRVEWCQDTCGIRQSEMRARERRNTHPNNFVSRHEDAGDENDMVGTCPVE